MSFKTSTGSDFSSEFLGAQRSMLLYVYDWHDVDVDCRNHETLMFCYKENDEKCVLRIQDNRPYIYCREQDVIGRDFYEKNSELNHETFIPYFSRRYQRSVADVKFQSRPLFRRMHTGPGEQNFTKIYFSTLARRNSAIRKMKEEKIEIFHETLDPCQAMMAERDMRTMGWFELNEWMGVRPDQQLTICSREYIARKRDVFAIEREDIPRLNIVSIDIECFSHDGTFPDVYDPRNFISVIALSRLRYGDDRSKIEKYALYKSKSTVKINDVECIRCDKELELIRRMFELITDLQADVVTGYNIFNFDFKYIWRRYSWKLDHKYFAGPMEAEVEMKESHEGNKQWDGSPLVEMEIPGITSIDVFQYVLKQYSNLKRKSLDHVSRKFLNMSKIPLSAAKMFELIREDTSESMKEVIDYCVHDTYVTLLLMLNLNILIASVEMSNMSHMRLHQYFLTGSTKKYKNQLYNLCIKEKVVLDEQRVVDRGRNRGGFVMDPEVGVHDWTSVIDFKSLYPSIMIAYNICPTTYVGNKSDSERECHEIVCNVAKISNGKEIEVQEIHYFLKEPRGLIPNLCKQLLEMRDHYKDLAKKSEGTMKFVYDSRQNVLKITANSVYGCYGTGTPGVVTFREGAECITSIGREYIKRTKNVVEKDYGAKVVYGDTDSCMVSFADQTKRMHSSDDIETRRKKIAEWCRDRTIEICGSETLTKYFLDPISIKYEMLFEKLLLLKKKKYSGLDYFSKQMYIKGIFKGDVCQYAKDVYEETLSNILTGKSSKEIYETLKKRFVSLEREEIDDQDLVILTKVKSDYRTPCARATFKRNMKDRDIKIDPGEELELVFVKSEGSVGDKLRVLQYNTEPLDYKYYAYKQIYPQVKTMLELFDPYMAKLINLLAQAC